MKDLKQRLVFRLKHKTETVGQGFGFRIYSLVGKA